MQEKNLLDQAEEKKAFKYFNISVFLHFIGRQVYNIFTPIILLKNGYGLSAVLVFFIISSFITIISSYLGEKIFFKRNVICFNIVAIFAEIALLLFLSYNNASFVALLLIALFEALYYSFYYISYFAIVTHYTSVKRTGINLGNLSIAVSFSSMIAPIAGAYLLLKNKIYLIALSISFLTASLLPLVKIVKKDINGINLEKIKLGDLKLELFNYAILAAYEMIIYFLWGLYAYTIGISLIYVGTIPMLSALASIIFAHSIKTHVNKEIFRKRVISFSIVLISLFSFLRYFYPQTIILTNFLFSIFFLGLEISLSLELLNKMKDHQTYFSSMILSIVSFLSRAIIAIAALIIGLKQLILLPLFLMVIYFAANRKVAFLAGKRVPEAQ